MSPMTRMMDSLVLDPFSPFAFTKITTTHRPSKTGSINRRSGNKTASKPSPVKPEHNNISNSNSNNINNSSFQGKLDVSVFMLFAEEKKISLFQS